MPAGFRIALLALLPLAAEEAIAFDVGDPTFPTLAEPSTRFEIIYESMSRDVWMGIDRPRLQTSPGGPIAIATSEPARIDGTEEADLLTARWVHHPISYFSAQFDLGLAGDSSGDDTQFVIGGAIRTLLTESGPFQLVSHIDAHFVPQFQTYDTGTSVTRGAFVSHGDYDAYEYGAALLASMTSTTDNGYVTTVYGGPRLSVYRGEMRSFADFANGDRMWIDGIVKQASPFGVVIGTRFHWGETWSARVEGRLVEEQSLSVGLSASY